MSDEFDLTAPRETLDLIGHEEAERALLSAWQSGRMSHAWLLTGPKGIGKATLAFRFARFVLAQADAAGLFGDAPDSLAVAAGDPVFTQVAAGSHPNLLTIERSWDDKAKRLRKEITIGDTAPLRTFVGNTAASAGWRVVIIDSVDEMNRNAANAILKVLEEPPRNVLFLLVVHAVGRILPTIRSRCRELRLTPLSDDQVETRLAALLPDTDIDTRQLAARLGEGSLGRAVHIAEQGGLDSFRDLVALLADGGRDRIAIHDLCDRFAPAGAEPAYRSFVDLLQWWMGRAIKVQALGQAEGLGAGNDLFPGDSRAIDHVTRGRTLDQSLELWEKMARLFERADSVNLSRKQVMVNVLTALAQREHREI
jgi:DNA polymerase-3 subunit delta'